MYLVDVDSESREDATVRQLLSTPFMLEGLLDPLGIHPELWWAATKIPHACLVQSFSGDVDIVFGRCRLEEPGVLGSSVERWRERYPNAPQWMHENSAVRELAAAGGLKWPPPLDYLVAVETKCGLYDREKQEVRSQKASPGNRRRVQRQVELLSQMGFNRVVLLDVIANPPAIGGSGSAWLNAGAGAQHALDNMRATLEKRLGEEAPGGHVVLSWGAVAGGDETTRGAGYPQWLRAPVDNPLLGDRATHERRQELESNLRNILAAIPRPCSFPFLIESPLQARYRASE